MVTTDDRQVMGVPQPLETIAIGGTLVALGDIANAMTFWALYKQVPPTRILQSVAAGLLGKKAAFAGGLNTALLGAGLHVFIAMTVAAVFYIGCRRWPALLRRPVVAGPAYGLIVFVVMNYAVIPASRIGFGKMPPVPWVVDEVIGHAVLVGLPVALVARWSANRRARPA